MRMKAPAVDPRLDPKRDGDKLSVGAQVYKDGKPITIIWDNGVFYEYIEGHPGHFGANDRSGLSVEEEDQE